MTDERIFKLKKAQGLICVVLEELEEEEEGIETDPHTSTWLRVAGNYCREVAEEMVKEITIP